MGAFISEQPNGLYCRFSTIVDCPTHWNMTREDYLNGVTGTVASREDGEEILKNWMLPFSEVEKRFQPYSMTQHEFDKFITEVNEDFSDEIL